MQTLEDYFATRGDQEALVSIPTEIANLDLPISVAERVRFPNLKIRVTEMYLTWCPQSPNKAVIVFFFDDNQGSWKARATFDQEIPNGCFMDNIAIDVISLKAAILVHPNEEICGFIKAMALLPFQVLIEPLSPESGLRLTLTVGAVQFVAAAQVDKS